MKLVFFFMESKENQLEFGINGKFLTNSGDHSQKNAWIFGSWTPLTVATNWNFCASLVEKKLVLFRQDIDAWHTGPQNN